QILALTDALLADKAYESNWIIADLRECDARIVISQRPPRTNPIEIDGEMYNWRHVVENDFGKLKKFKRVAFRSDKTDDSFLAMIYLAATVIELR
ncbi:MAG: transposase, partial [Alphaproteobacteria bacterium]|nr:transposase [Alphaproteobacteria bacterium]